MRRHFALLVVVPFVALFWSGVSAAPSTMTVIGVEAARGLITAVERTSGNIFTFSVKDKNVLAAFKPCTSFEADVTGLKAGQTFGADLGPFVEVKVNAAGSCCTLVGTPGTAGRVLGVQPHGKFQGLEIFLLEIKRTEGDLATATCLYCNGGTMQVDLASDLRARASNAKLLDTANRVEHRVMRAGGRGGDAMVSNHGPGLKLAPNQTARTWMTFSAPKADTVALDVPGAASPFQNVPVVK
jgi:hypothetical protein